MLIFPTEIYSENSKARLFLCGPLLLSSLCPRWRQKIRNCCQSTFPFAFQLIFCGDKKQIGNARLGSNCCEKSPSHLLHQGKTIIHHPSRKSQEVNQKPCYFCISSTCGHLNQLSIRTKNAFSQTSFNVIA